jgi:glycine cleavage system aminomethyltransferase T
VQRNREYPSFDQRSSLGTELMTDAREVEAVVRGRGADESWRSEHKAVNEVAKFCDMSVCQVFVVI